MEEVSADKKYLQADLNRKQELDNFLNLLDELLEIYCEYNFEHPEQKTHYYEDEEEWEL